MILVGNITAIFINSDHLTKIPIGSSVAQIAVSETSRKRPPLVSDHLTKIPIGSSVSQIAISETSRKRPPFVSDLVAYGSFHCNCFSFLFAAILKVLMERPPTENN